MSTRDWELGGLTDINGHLGKPVPSGKVLVPGKIELADNALHWELAGPARFQEISRSTLNEFVKLWDQESLAILKFAKKWGVLAMRTTGKDSVLYRPCGEAMTAGSDPIHAWRYYSQRAHAVLNIAAALRQDKLGDLGDWSMIAAIDDKPESYNAATARHNYGLGWYLFPQPMPGRNILEQGRQVVAREVASWLAFWRRDRMEALSDFTLEWSPRSARWELKVDYHGFLFAALALQLALSIAGADSLYTCTGCGAPYVREVKRPKPGTANYCPQCSAKGIAQRRAVDAYREKKAEAARFHAAGMAADDIAQKLGAPISRVKRWLGKEAPARRKPRKPGR